MPDSRTIIGVTKPFATSTDPAKSGEIHVQLSDGTDVESAGIVDRTENGVGVQRVELRTAAGLVDGPLYTDYVCFRMRALGATVPDVAAPIAKVLTPAPTPTPAPNVITLPPAPAAAAPAAVHAAWYTHLFSALEKVAVGAGHVVTGAGHVLENPVVAALIPAKYAGITAAVVGITEIANAESAPAS